MMTTMHYSELSLDDVDFATPMLEHLNHLDHDCGSSDGTPDDNDESDDDRDDDTSLSTGNYSPPAWRRLENGDRWYGNWRSGNELLVHRALNKSVPFFNNYDSDMFEAARRTRLPTGSLSPEKGRSPEPELRRSESILSRMMSGSIPPVKRIMNGTPERTMDARAEDMEIKETAGLNEKGQVEVGPLMNNRQSRALSPSPGPSKDNYIRFAVRADIQQRTEPIDAVVNFFQNRYRLVTKSWTSLIVAILGVFLSLSASQLLFQPMSLRPVPDLVKVAGLARSFEPLIYYSENGVSQVGDLQATGVAVWDLGESVRSSNLTSAPIIVKSLDELSDSLKILSVELTKFFANVDGDIDSILIVMDWARRELSQLHSQPSAPFSTAFSNLHSLLCTTGLLEDPDTGRPTKFGVATTAVFGLSQFQHRQQTLKRTFTEFLSVLEEAIENELQHSLALFGLFETIDRQFLNLARLVVRESSQQDEQHADSLSSLWTRILGAKASELHKYERNRQLLSNVRDKTVRNKGILIEHNGRLLTLKASLENIRRKLVSPLVRSVNSTTLTLEDQIRGLQDVGGYLEGVRTRQKGKLMERLYGDTRGGRPRVAHTASARLIDEESHRSH